MTVLEELYKHLEVNDPEFWNAQMILDWAKENKQRFLDKEQEQLNKAWQDGAVTAQKVWNETAQEQLRIGVVSNSEVFEHYGKPFTSGRDLWDFLTAHYNFTPKT